MPAGRTRILRYWIPVICWMSLISLASSLSGKDIPNVGIPYIDKLAHFAEYLILCMLLLRAFLSSCPRISFTKIIILSFIIALSYGAIDEWRQQSVPGRTADIFDLVSDASGAGAAIVIYKRVRKCHR